MRIYVLKIIRKLILDYINFKKLNTFPFFEVVVVVSDSEDFFLQSQQ